MFQRYTHILSALGPGASYKITVNNRHINMTEWESDTLLPLLDPDDGKNADREEYNGMLREQIAGSDGIRQEKYLTVTVSKPSLAAARSYFSMAAASLRSAFASINAVLHASSMPKSGCGYSMTSTVQERRTALPLTLLRPSWERISGTALPPVLSAVSPTIWKLAAGSSGSCSQ